MTKSSDNQNISLISAVDDRRKRADTKALDVSLNELADMYESGELTIQPEYQRMFRWPASKQSQFIESLILEMPIPPIFVIELEEGHWELIDGLQRISSYLHFRGMLDSPLYDPPIAKGDSLRLEDCDIIEELNKLIYDDLPAALQIRLKRSFLTVEVIRKDTDFRFRYYMFKRLNTGGEPLAEQEVRNCTIRLLGDEFNNFIQELSRNADFQSCIAPLSKESRRRMGDVELVLRFFAFKNNFDDFKHDVQPFMTDYMERVTDQASSSALPFDYEAERAQFEKIFLLLNRTLGSDTCQRWLGGGSDRFGGGFSNHHFEAMSLGVAKVVNDLEFNMPQRLESIKKALIEAKKDAGFVELTTGGGKNSPGLYERKIDFVAGKLRGLS